MRKHSGFSLVELSIVLVILGLLVGGILGGQSLIKAAELRKFTVQITELNTGVNTFRSRFNCLPGDCSNLFNFTGVEAGNEDGKINSYNPYGAYTRGRNIGCETTDAFAEMAQAGIIAGNYDASSRIVGQGYPAAINDVGRGGIGIFNILGKHYFRTGVEAPVAYGGGTPAGFSTTCTDTLSYMHIYAFTPEEAAYITGKMGDTKANQTIKIVGWGNYDLFDWTLTTDSGNSPTIIGPANGAGNAICYETTTGTFNVQYGEKICNLVIPASF